MTIQIPFDNSYARLPERFFARVAPTPVAKPYLMQLNDDLARQLRLNADDLRTEDGVAFLAGNRIPNGAEPLAMAYAGFQFGNWVPQLGDGRAVLLGEVIDADQVRYDIQLKGAGRTPFSRGGDGRAGVGPVLREYLLSEAMARLGIATTRSLAAVATGEQIARESLLPGAVLTRVARSHVRVGTFQYFAARNDIDALRTLADHTIERLYPELSETKEPYRELLTTVIERQAALVADWQAVGFIHGVMNTDNTSIAGETIDYGPCAFMDHFHPATVYSSIDHRGRYAYGNQPAIAQWNLAGLAETLLPLIHADEEIALNQAQEAIRSFPALFENIYSSRMRRKIGLSTTKTGDDLLVQDLLKIMADNNADFTLSFRHLTDLDSRDTGTDETTRSLFATSSDFNAWVKRWKQRLEDDPQSTDDRHLHMRAVNPLYIPRNHLVEEALNAAIDEADLAPFHQLSNVLASPYEEQPGAERYATPPQPEEVVHQTFCGT